MRWSCRKCWLTGEVETGTSPGSGATQVLEGPQAAGYQGCSFSGLTGRSISSRYLLDILLIFHLLSFALFLCAFLVLPGILHPGMERGFQGAHQYHDDRAHFPG